MRIEGISPVSDFESVLAVYTRGVRHTGRNINRVSKEIPRLTREQCVDIQRKVALIANDFNKGGKVIYNAVGLKDVDGVVGTLFDKYV